MAERIAPRPRLTLGREQDDVRVHAQVPAEPDVRLPAAAVVGCAVGRSGRARLPLVEVEDDGTRRRSFADDLVNLAGPERTSELLEVEDDCLGGDHGLPLVGTLP